MMNQAMGTTMDNPACEWVRGTPALVDGRSARTRTIRNDDGGDLGVEDRRSIGRHLKGCPGCRRTGPRSSRSMEALAVASGSLPIAPDAPSLWASLEQRIAAHPSHDGSEKPPAWEPAAGRELALASLDGERPLQSAWMQDTLRELLDAAGPGALADRSGGAGRGPFMRSPRAATRRWRIAGASLAASVLALLVVLPASWRQRAGAEARIRENAAPVAAMVELPAEPQPEAPLLVESDSEDDRDIAAGQLAQSEPIHPLGRADARGRRHGGCQALGADAVRLRPRAWDAHAARGREVKPVY